MILPALRIPPIHRRIRFIVPSFSLTAIDPLTEDLVDPAGLGRTDPEFSWRVSGESGCEVTGYRLQVAATRRALESGGPFLWDSGDVRSTRTRTTYAGEPLHSRDSFFWRVRATGVGRADTGRFDSAWSTIASAEIGLVHPSEWKAAWITHPAWVDEPRPVTAPIVGTSFEVSRRVERARLFVSGLGVYVVEIDGTKVDDAVLEPGTSDFGTRVAARAIDVEPHLGPGRHRITVRLGEGSAHVRQAEGRYSKFIGTRGVPSALAALEIEYVGGGSERIATDETWRASDSATVFTHWYGGEEYDASLAPPAPEAWLPVAVLESAIDGPAPWWRAAPPVRVIETLPPRSVTVLDEPDRASSETSVVYDFGMNLAGRFHIDVDDGLSRGSRLVLWPAELLGADGHVDQSTGGRPIFDVYTVGDTPGSWAPEFCYHGFRYVEVRGPEPLANSPEIVRMTAEVLRVDDAETGRFASSDPRLEHLDRLITQAVRSNLFWMPTDCPHREKLGWLEQLHLVFGPLAHRFDLRAHFRDVVTNMIDAQTADGLVPDIAPELTVFEGGFRSDVNWGAAILEIPWRLFVAYGDTRILRESWDAGERYLSYLESLAGAGLLVDYGLGDWITLDDSTPRDLVTGFGYVHVLDTAARIADVLGHDSQADRYRSRADGQRRQLRDRFVDAGSKKFGSGSQGSLALLLDLDLLGATLRSEAVDSLISAIRADGHFTVGEVALPSLLRVLTAAGEHELIHATVVQVDHPGYGQMIAGDLTALAESWDNHDHPNSANHFMLGVIGDWLVGSVAGLAQQPGSIGWDALRIAPVLLEGVSRSSASYRSRHGDIEVGWHRSPTAFELTVTVPMGTTATVEVPKHEGHVLRAAPCETTPTEMAFVAEVGHGVWHFETILAS